MMLSYTSVSTIVFFFCSLQEHQFLYIQFLEMFSRRDMNPIDIACPPTFTFLLIYGDFDNFHLVSLSPNLSLSPEISRKTQKL